MHFVVRFRAERDQVPALERKLGEVFRRPDVMHSRSLDALAVSFRILATVTSLAQHRGTQPQPAFALVIKTHTQKKKPGPVYGASCIASQALALKALAIVNGHICRLFAVSAVKPEALAALVLEDLLQVIVPAFRARDPPVRARPDYIIRGVFFQQKSLHFCKNNMSFKSERNIKESQQRRRFLRFALGFFGKAAAPIRSF